MRKSWILLLMLLIAMPVQAVVLTWDAPTTNADDTPLTDLHHMLVYHAPLGQNYPTPMNVGLSTSASLAGLTPGTTYRFQASAVDTSGNESTLSIPAEYTEPADTTPPTAGSSSVVDGAMEIDPNITLTATFSESVNASSVNAQTVRLLAPDGSVVPSAVSYNASTRQVTLNPTNTLAAGTTYTWVMDGVTDLAGNLLTPFELDFTTATTPVWNCPCSVWASNEVPANPSDPDGSAVELGMKFRSAVAGQITGVRYYKSSQNTGTHTAKLWSRTGTLLRSATFPSSQNSGSGWKQVMFATPVTIQANTTYVVSYRAPNGHYAGDTEYFSQARTRGPLTALADGTDGGNGVYKYGSSGFPTNTWMKANYWVDVIFQPIP